MELIDLIFCPSKLQLYVLAFNIAKLAQPLPKFCVETLSLDDSVRPRQNVRRNRKVDLLGGFEID